MKTRFDETLETDSRPSRAIVAAYRAGICDENDDTSLALVHYRGTREELNIGLEYSLSPDPLDRATGADVLAQLGWYDCSFPRESVGRLIELLGDSDAHVISSAAIGLGHRGDSRAIPSLAALANHPAPQVRQSVAYGLGGHEDEHAIAALLDLARDEDAEVRSWAVFGLGSQIEADTPEIRAALRTALEDTDPEIRGEGLVGLARRSDPELPAFVLRELREHGEPGGLCLEAAEALLGPEFDRLMDQDAREAEEGGDSSLRINIIAVIEKTFPGSKADRAKNP